MSPRLPFQARMVESIGAPLMQAITAAQPQDQQSANKTAALMAEMITRSVQLGINLAGSLHLKGSDTEAGAIRLALTALASTLIAELYRRSGQAPSEADIRRLQPALDAVLTFADQMAPDSEGSARMAALEPGSLAADEHQAMLQILQALAPVVAEISTYAFGRPERKMAQEVCDRLMTRANAMRASLFPTLKPGDDKSLEAALLRTLCVLYIECHRAEIRRLENMSDGEKADAGAASIPLDALWASFEERAAMLEILSSDANAQMLSSGAGAATAAPRAAAPAARPEVQAPPPETSKAPEDAQDNPMAFFRPGVKKARQGAENSDNRTA